MASQCAMDQHGGYLINFKRSTQLSVLKGQLGIFKALHIERGRKSVG